MAFGQDAVAEWQYSAKFRDGEIEEDNSNKDFGVSLLVLKEKEWEEKVVDRIFSISCADMNDLAIYNSKVKIDKTNNQISNEQERQQRMT